jgi:membrane protein implicated in regulation of membrane protease activity
MFLSIFPVWSELNLMTQIYWAITVPATLIFLLILILTIFGSDLDSDVQTGIDSSIADGDSIPFQFLSAKSIVGFFVMFGWSGLGLLSAGVAPFLAILLSTICGLLMMVAMASLFYFMSKLTDDGTLKMKNAIGRLGEVYLTIPGNRRGMGKVQLTVQGSIRTLDAITDDPDQIATSSLIEVLDVIDQQILLVKRNSR